MDKRPNIVFYFSDQQRWDTCGCYGQKLDVTPNLDKLAKDGIVFDNAFTVQPVCGPARAVLQSGQYATEVGCYKNGISLPTDIETIAKCFNKNGYETAYVGKWHLASDDGNSCNKSSCNLRTMATPPDRRGGYKDYWCAADVLEFTSHGYNGYVFDKDCNKLEFIGYRADAINNYAVDYIANKTSENPFFLFISQIEPHYQNDRGVFEGPYGSKTKFKDFEVPGDLKNTKGDWRENYPDYLGQCNSLDSNVGKLVDVLKDKGLWDNTILIYTSDHGCHFRTRAAEYKRSCHDSSIHIPLIIHGPGFSGGKRIKELVSLLDLPTTILSCANIEQPKAFKGRKLDKLVNGESEDWLNEIYIQISEAYTGRALRTERYTYSIKSKDDIDKAFSHVYVEEFLYDNYTDPNQKNNLISDASLKSVKDYLRERIKIRMQEANEEEFQILSYEEII